MGLIKAGMGAVGGVLGDQWKEFIYCDSLAADVLVTKGQKRLSSEGRSSNTSGEANVISNGSVIAVNEGYEFSSGVGHAGVSRHAQPLVFRMESSDFI